MIVIRRKIFSNKHKGSDKSNIDVSDKAVVGGITGSTAGILGLSTTKTGRLTGKVTRYHNTNVENVEDILKNGIKARYAEDPGNLTNKVLGDIPMDKKRNLVYTAKQKRVADEVGMTRIDNPKQWKQKTKTLKLEFDYDQIKDLGRIENPELRGAKDFKGYLSKLYEAHPVFSSYVKELPVTKRKKILADLEDNFRTMGNGTHIFKGDISPEHIVGGIGYKKRTGKQVLNYIKNNPGRFGKEAGKVALSAAALGTGAGLVAHELKKSKKKD